MQTPLNAKCTVCNIEVPAKSGKYIYKEPVCKKCHTKFMVKRQIAFAIDWTLLAIIWQTGILLAEVSFSGSSSMPAAKVLHDSLAYPFILWTCICMKSILITLFWLVLFALFLIRDGWKGHFYGKRIMGLQVVNAEDGKPISFLQSLYRNALFLFLPIAGPIYYYILNYFFLLTYENKLLFFIRLILTPIFLLTPYILLYLLILIVAKIGFGYNDKLAKAKVIISKYRDTSPFVPDEQQDSEYEAET